MCGTPHVCIMHGSHSILSCAADFFTSVINVKLVNAIFFTVMVYVVSFFFWACVWYLLWRRVLAPCPCCQL